MAARYGPWLAFGLTLLAWRLGVGPLDGFYWSSLFITAGALAIAAVAQLFVLASGSQGLGGGAAIALVNVLVVTGLRDDPTSIATWTLAGPAIGAGIGLVNGALVGWLGLSSTLVTLATSVVVYGVTLTFLDVTAPPAPAAFMTLVTGDAVPGIVPASALLVAGAALAAALILRSRLGRDLYAVGRDMDTAARAGVAVGRTRAIAHVLAGAGYGAAGVFVAGVTGSADPLIGAPTVLQIYAAVAIGGVALGGGRGGPFGAAVGALTVASASGLLFVIDAPAFWSTAVEGVLLIVGLLMTGSRLAAIPHRAIRSALGAALRGRSGGRPTPLPNPDPPTRAPWWPALGALLLVAAVTAFIQGGSFDAVAFGLHLPAAAALLGLLAIGQTLVMATRGLDVSLPAIMAVSASLFAMVSTGVDSRVPLAIAVAMAAGLAIGLANGLAVALLGLRPLFVTLAVAGGLQALVIDATLWTNERFVAPSALGFVTGTTLGVPNPALALVAIAIVAALLARRTGLGAGAAAVAGAAPVPSAAHGAILVAVHALAGLCAAAAGILGSVEPAPARFGIGDTYLLPSVAAAVLGGMAVGGGRPSIAGAVAGALLVSAIPIALGATTLHYGYGHALVGVLIVIWLIAPRIRRPGRAGS
jgi:ribose transport system permease protein